MSPSGREDLTINFGLSTLLAHASLPVLAAVAILLVASIGVWIVGFLKLLQLARLRGEARLFEARARLVDAAPELVALAAQLRMSSGSRVLRAIMARTKGGSAARLRAAADRAILAERQRARSLMPALASTGAIAPFVGLFGTVYGIMDAFVRIGAAKNASLPVVAPAIGEALITTAIGLAAAIPAVLFYNLVDKQVADFLAELEASAAEWIALLTSDNGAACAGLLCASDKTPPLVR
ncbi:MAG: MotA/TolQ/ExbB proton channel family protein [Polyangia bacterium]|jgi:biopolymer transport protein TolQ